MSIQRPASKLFIRIFIISLLIVLNFSYSNTMAQQSIPGDKIYGVRWSLDKLSSKCERIDDSVGMVASANKGSSIAKNNFDSIYPWSDIRLCTIDKNGKIVYKGEKGFALDGSSGNVFVELPVWYIQRKLDSSYEYLRISKEKLPGYEVEPAFMENGKVMESIYVGAYDGFVTADNVLVSWSGTYPTVNRSLASFRKAARNNGGNGYGCIDIRTVIALQHLYMIEFADKNSSGTVGTGIQRMQYPYSKSADITEAQSNRIILENSLAEKFKIGQSCGISEYNVYLMDHRTITNVKRYSNTQKAVYFSGGPYNIHKGTTYIYNTPLKNGLLDKMLSPSGFVDDKANKNGYSSVRYRFIENIWGNIWNCVDGIIVSDRIPYICYDMTKYGNKITEEYLPLDYRLPLQEKNQTNDSYKNELIKNLGFDTKFPAIGLPAEVGKGTDRDNSFGDALTCTNGEREVRWKGAWDVGINQYDKAGIFMLRATFIIDGKYWHDGARLIYKPIDK